MKKIFLYIFILGFFSQINAQHELKRAQNYFERAFYSDAIPLYEALILKNRSNKTVANLAESYYHTFQMKKAAKWYGILIQNNNTQRFENLRQGDSIAEVNYFRYYQALKSSGELQKATTILAEFYSRTGNTEKHNRLQEEAQYLSNISAIGARFTIENLAINTEKSEFGAIAIDSNLIFTAARKTNTIFGKAYKWNNQNYLDLYIAPLVKLKLGDTISKSFSKNINTKMHEGTFAITKDRLTIYFTRNNYLKGKKTNNSKKINTLNIYKAEWINGKWTNITELPFNSKNFSSEHPALSPDENTLYFSSDKSGGYGGFDIYSVSIKDNTFGTPKNLGSTINTSRKEQFPFIDSNGDLYFSSNGHPGFGLLDIFISKNKDGVFQKPDNIGLPANSGYDDFTFSKIPNTKKGYFSSNRPTGKGSDDIYAFTETKPLLIEDCKQYIKGILTDITTKLPITGGTITISNEKGEVVETITTTADASFNFSVSCNNNITITGNKIGYNSNSKTIRLSSIRNMIHDGSLALLSIAEKEKLEEIAAQKEKELQKIKKEEEIAAQILKEKQEKIIAEKKKEVRKTTIIQTEKSIVKSKKRVVIKTDPIRFDYKLWYLRRDARLAIDKVIAIMKRNPEIRVEIGTHTDIRGNNKYNQELSQKRANSVREYFIKNKISESRILAKGYGEAQPIIHCKTEESCSEEEHEINRRCEFVIVKWG